MCEGKVECAVSKLWQICLLFFLNQKQLKSEEKMVACRAGMCTVKQLGIRVQLLRFISIISEAEVEEKQHQDV